MNVGRSMGFGLLFFVWAMGSGAASERLFTYSYEPETMPKGAREFENWVTLRTQRNDTVGQHNYNRWELRQELEYGVTDEYTISLYLNESAESFTPVETDGDTGAEVKGDSHHESSFDGVSIENRWMVLNPATNPVGLTLYFEPRFSGEALELEEKIILGQRVGDWKWALNVGHATEWTEDFNETEGELEFTFGITREINRRWNLGVEFRDHNELPEYAEWENTALFVGPVVSYRRENWWMTLTAMAQVYGKNFQAIDPDRIQNFELEGHEYVNIRCAIGIEF
ncbi:MAG: hypothetical protein AUJ71_01525 [Candidatus Omnitrophica bacterium CG1_02_49_16]|nr:MAG: hypothetical protein AUJ71_01525 [Candidatus Omnitrophica bacterium CG1_02_49_16]